MKLLPSEHEATRLRGAKEREEQETAQRTREAALLRAVDALLRQEWGRVFWAHLFNVCGYNKPSLSRVSGGDIAPLSTECKDAQRLIYLELRKLALPELLSKAEFFAEFGETTEKGEVKNGAA